MAYFKLSSENLNSLLGIKENKVKLSKWDREIWRWGYVSKLLWVKDDFYPKKKPWY